MAADQATILQALGVLDPDGKPTALVDTVKGADVARLTQENWQRERDKVIKTCNRCHSGNFARQQLQQGLAQRYRRYAVSPRAARMRGPLCFV